MDNIFFLLEITKFKHLPSVLFIIIAHKHNIPQQIAGGLLPWTWLNVTN